MGIRLSIVRLAVALVLGGVALVKAQQPPDPDYCVNNYCGIGDGDCDPGQCDEGVCMNDVGAQHGLPAHYDVCEEGSRPDPDYCVGRACGAGEGDCDPGQCAAGLTCVNDVGARYGLPAHYDVCETVGSICQQTHAFDGIWDFELTMFFPEYCRFWPPERFWIKITNSGVWEFSTDDATSARVAVRETGQIEGALTLPHPPDFHQFSISGWLDDSDGAGTWFDVHTCAGGWTATRR